MMDLVILNLLITLMPTNTGHFWWSYLQAFRVTDFSQLLLVVFPDFTTPRCRCGEANIYPPYGQTVRRDYLWDVNTNADFVKLMALRFILLFRFLSFLKSKVVSFPPEHPNATWF